MFHDYPINLENTAKLNDNIYGGRNSKFWERGENIIWGDLAFYGGTWKRLRNHDSVATHSKPKLGKRKLKQVEDNITKKLVSVPKVDQTELKEEYVQNNIPAENQSMANDLDYLVDYMKDKSKISNRRKRLLILTLVPNPWSLRKAVGSIFSF